ncbi:MAG: ester cyclase [Chloroflexota bacterium]|nr:ester cyclase [Chloroflexota bacterium]
MSQDPIAIGRSFFEQVLGTGDWAVAEKIVAPNVVMHHPSSPVPVEGYEAVKGMLSAFRAGFPSMSMTVEDAFGSGDKAAIRWRMQGVHSGDLFGIPPSGKQVNVSGISIVKVKDGKIVEDWVSEDTMGLMQQIGVVPA